MVFLAGKRHIRLDSLRDGQKFLSKLINQRYRDEIAGDVCRDLGFLLKIYLTYFESFQLDSKISELEEKLNQIKNNKKDE